MHSAKEKSLAPRIEGTRRARVVDAQHARRKRSNHERRFDERAVADKRPDHKRITVAPDRERCGITSRGRGELRDVLWCRGHWRAYLDNRFANVRFTGPRERELGSARLFLMKARKEAELDEALD